jgi:hypothetical protein
MSTTSNPIRARHSFARDGGCTRPNCLEPGYHSEIHHCPHLAAGGSTDADTLF